MSRFATPNRSRPLVVANSPSIPLQKEPGHRYANGIQIPGPSFKGRHVIEIKVNGLKMHSPTRERPLSAERAVSPGGTIRDLQTTHKVTSMADSHTLPKPTTKPFVIPERTRRNSSARSLTSSALSEIDLTAGKSINRSRSTTPTRRLSRDYSVNSEVVSVSGPPRSTSAQSVRSSSNRSVSSAVSSISGTAYGSSVRSFSAGRGPRSHSPIQYLTGGHHSSLSNSSAHIHQSLASTSRKNNDQTHQRHANKLELSQSAYRHFRKAVVRDAIHNFLQGEDAHREQLDAMALKDEDDDDLSLNDLLDLSLAGHNNQHHSPHSNNYESGEDSHGEDETGWDMNRSIATSKMAMGKEDRKKFRRLHKMIKLLRQSIVDDLNLQGLTLPNADGPTPDMVTPETLFFPSQHMHSVMVANSRRELLDLIVQWRQLYTDHALSALDRYYARWVTVRSERLQAQRRLQQATAEQQAQEKEKQSLREEILHLRQRAEELGLSLPKNWFPAELGLDAPFYLTNNNNNNTMASSQSVSGVSTVARSISPTATMGTGTLRNQPFAATSDSHSMAYSTNNTMMSPTAAGFDKSQSVFLSPKNFIQSSIRSLSQSSMQPSTPSMPSSTTQPAPFQQQQRTPTSAPVRVATISPSPSIATNNSSSNPNQTNNANNNNTYANNSNNINPMSPNPARGRFSYNNVSSNNSVATQQPPPNQPQASFAHHKNETKANPSSSSNILGEGKMSINLDVLRALNSPSGSAPLPLSVSAAATTSYPLPPPSPQQLPTRNSSMRDFPTESPTTAVRKHLSNQVQPNLHSLMYSKTPSKMESPPPPPPPPMSQLGNSGTQTSSINYNSHLNMSKDPKIRARYMNSTG